MRIAILIVAALLAGCASRPLPVAIVPPAPVPVSAPPPVLAPTPINAGLSPAATLWHLRAGLNVAALACRGPDEAATVAQYNALLAGHRATLAAAEAAYAAEYQAAGGEWRDRYDDSMTRLYNFFGQARGRTGFCTEAKAALASMAALPDAELQAGAAATLARLDTPFTPPWIAVDASVFGNPAVQVAAR